MTFALGLIMDFSSAMLVGPWAGALIVVYGVLAVLSHRLFIESGVAAMIITFLSVVAANVLFSLFGAEYPSMNWEYPMQVFGQAVVTSSLAPLALSLLSRRSRRRASIGVGRGTALSAV
jgi:cell shape-determining protein MreD